jgi:hypothetical protein
MDRVDAVVLALLAILDLSFLFHLRWRRGRSSRIERRIVRSLSVAIRRREPA